MDMKVEHVISQENTMGENKRVTREERKRAIAIALVNANGGTDTPERTRLDLSLSAGYMAMAEEALRVADATREPCECRQCHLDSLVADKPAFRTERR
jgi:hypothetical protein